MLFCEWALNYQPLSVYGDATPRAAEKCVTSHFLSNSAMHSEKAFRKGCMEEYDRPLSQRKEGLWRFSSVQW